jgi:hypothetical protein
VGNQSDLLEDGDKFALVALRTRVEVSSAFYSEGPPPLWGLVTSPVSLDANWERWVGSIRAEHLAEANLFLVTKKMSSAPEVIDEENSMLERYAYWFYTGLLLSARLTTFDDPMMLTGVRHRGLATVRRVGHASRAAPILGLLPEPVTLDSLKMAAAVAMALREWGSAGGSWRFNRVLQIYAAARADPDPLERIHQFSRCIDGLILPDVGKTTKQFVSRTETFIGPHAHEEMAEVYNVRSKVEHLREYEILEPPDRVSREDLVRKAAIVENISRRCIARVLLTKALWPHFSNPAALASFWRLPPDQRSKLWGSAIHLASDLSDFSPQYLRNEDLGLT